LGAPFYNLLEYFDKVKTNRVGSRDFGDAVDPDALNAKAHTAELVHSASQERINLMARIFAETVVKQIFWKILELTSKHQQKPQVVKLRVNGSKLTLGSGRANST
jgi:NAD(P)H-hydrate repair Nnr-like enzyme with NAD(P)H-hydrate dehydratase domain